ncbi:hypothetical protein pipiens_018205, partial [Culex pipiens pipiens]
MNCTGSTNRFDAHKHTHNPVRFCSHHYKRTDRDASSKKGKQTNVVFSVPKVALFGLDFDGLISWLWAPQTTVITLTWEIAPAGVTIPLSHADQVP